MEKIRFDDFIKLNRGFDLPDSQIEEGTYPVVASTNIKAFHSTYKVNGPMVVTGRSGSLGAVQYIEGKCWPLNTTLYVKDFKGNDPRYVYYFLKTMHLEQYNAGAGVPTLNQNHLHSLKINVHEKESQRRIASILSAYDNLIENNNKRIRLLEQMAENLYKEWFVRFRFPGHEKVEMENGLPKGWKKGKLRDLAIEVDKAEKADNRNMYNHYLPIDKLPMKSMVLQEEDSVENAESSLIAFKRGDILFGAMRPYFHKVLLAPFDGLTRTTCFVVNAREPFYRLFLYMLMFQKSTVDYASTVAVGSTMPYDRWKDLSRMNIVTPDLATIERFNGEFYKLIH